jgi:hypothetical protein
VGTREHDTDTAINNVTAPFVSHAVSNRRKIEATVYGFTKTHYQKMYQQIKLINISMLVQCNVELMHK